MDINVSPIISPHSNAAVPEQPAWDDPYAFITNQSKLPKHEYYYIVEKIERNWITERDIELVRFVFVHRWLVLKQIERLFFPDVDRGKSVRDRINRLIKYGLLRKTQWSSYSLPEKNRPSIYELGDSGADILKYKYGIMVGQRDPRNPKTTTMIYRMRYVITNELYIQLKEQFELVHFEFHPSLKRKEALVIPTARFVLRNPKGKEMPFYLLCQREDEKWLKTIRFQARFFKEYFTSEERDTTIVVLVSSDERALLASKIAEQENLKGRIWFVTDKDLLDETVDLRNGFFVFNENQKIYYDLR
ncbi:replication-relaxation family protein [Paenibacillus sp. MWE-103]|uniref:Replication-relaxation family protein n=1 Tax=Paenibacillus artemisiicola TaxID=1172618 RepID=A0ABS3WCH1_9BACL|nr:replication-relaxation family protein [Paenibacillus artemisiicola]MBO7745810.1 replication-relaxation family protein [Paenibacillus artemisiicola]